MSTPKTIVMTVLATISLILLAMYTSWTIQKPPEQGNLEELFKANVGTMLSVPSTHVIEAERQKEKFATYLSAIQVARIALRRPEELRTPKESTSLEGVATKDQLDAWNHPFCVSRIEGKVVVISAGPHIDPAPGCQNVFASPLDFPHLRVGLIYTYPSGAIVMVFDKDLTEKAPPG
ncbi:MAG: hypothetical protein L0338_14660 [Acidobacteria bacterium]|nr:hypothetical protein [Acidobacteriota bacterium]